MDDELNFNSDYLDDNFVSISSLLGQIDSEPVEIDTSITGSLDNNDSISSNSDLDNNDRSDSTIDDLIDSIDTLTQEVTILHDDLNNFMTSNVNITSCILAGLFVFITLYVFRKVFDFMR